MSQESILGPYLKPGTPIKVGSYSTKIIRYLSEGGFSHVYTAKLDIPVKGSDVAVLKRIVAPDKTALAAIRTEVETMKKLKGHRYIVTYIDSHASALKGGGFEVYVLMEYCPGGGLIDFMNTRLQTRLAEWEVLKIISDTTEAVACMHYLRPPLLHRDLKIENVLISGNGDYKLCDFGSCTEPRSPATNSQERRELEDDIQKNTTIQYRSPEMVDVGRRLPIDEKSDIWALGVLLYKLCYFTTPFETQGPLAILNAAYTFPPYPPYTDRTKRLIAVTLQENPRDRPNIYQLLAEICAMRNVPVPIPDIYSKSRSTSQSSRSRANSRPPSAHNDDILTYEAAAAAAPKTPILDPTPREPMRRGRPERSHTPPQTDFSSLVHTQGTKENVQKMTSLPGSASAKPVIDEDEFASKFPSLEEMDLGLDQAGAGKASSNTNSLAATQTSALRGPANLISSATKVSDFLSEDPMPRPGSASRPLPPEPIQGARIDREEYNESRVRPSEIGKNGTYLRGSSSAQYTSKRDENLAEERAPEEIPPPQSSQMVENSDIPVRPLPGRLVRPAVNEPSKNSGNDPGLGMSDRLRARPHMVSRSSQTSPKPKQAVQTQTSPAKPIATDSRPGPEVSLSSNLMRDSSGFIVSRPAQKTEVPALQPKPQFKFTTSLDRPYDNVLARDQIARSRPSGGSRPQTIHVDSSVDYLRGLDSPATTTTAGSIEMDRTGNSLDSDIGRKLQKTYLDPSDARLEASNIRRSVSVSASNFRHGKRPSLTHISSFSGAAKIMNGKFGEAFKKFETSTRSRGTTPAIERSNPLQVAENDLPEHITQHLQTTEARRSSSYSRNRPSLDLLRQEQPPPILEKSSSVESTSTSVKEAMRRLKEKATQSYVPQRSAQGYGKYTEPEVPHRAATVIPYARVAIDEKPPIGAKPGQLHSKNARRYGLQEEDDDPVNFSKRYPSLSDFKV